MRTCSPATWQVFIAGMVLMCTATWAQGEDVKAGDPIREALARCRALSMSGKLDPIRSRIPLDGSETTSGMRAYDKRATASERTALAAYQQVQLECSAALAKAAFPNDSNAQADSVAKYKVSIAERVDPLQKGKITFAEYLRREDRRIAEQREAIRKATGLRAETERWLATMAPDVRGNRLWSEFAQDVLSIGERVDGGEITRDEGSRQIEERRQRFNNELADSTQVTLNCAYQTSNGQRTDRPATIDYTRRQVNGTAAVFSDTTIQWETASADGSYKYTHTLNRLSGFSSIGTGEFPSLLTGHCAPAKRQF